MNQSLCANKYTIASTREYLPSWIERTSGLPQIAVDLMDGHVAATTETAEDDMKGTAAASAREATLCSEQLVADELSRLNDLHFDAMALCKFAFIRLARANCLPLGQAIDVVQRTFAARGLMVEEHLYNKIATETAAVFKADWTCAHK